MSANPTTLVQAFLSTGKLPLSRSISQMQTMLSRADYNALDLAEYLRKDPTLAAGVMAVANSAFFSRSPSGTIDEAVNRLGTVQLTRIFSQVLSSAALAHPLRAYGLPADAIWRRSVLAAVGAEMAAMRQGEDRSAAYMVGLLHLMGLLVLNRLGLQQPMPPKLQYVDFNREWTGDEIKLCGLNQAALGAELLRQLNFPEAMVTVVSRQYHAPVEGLECSLYLGRLVRSTLCDPVPPVADPEVLQRLNFTSDRQLEDFIADVREETQRLINPG